MVSFAVAYPVHVPYLSSEASPSLDNWTPILPKVSGSNWLASKGPQVCCQVANPETYSVFFASYRNTGMARGVGAGDEFSRVAAAILGARRSRGCDTACQAGADN